MREAGPAKMLAAIGFMLLAMFCLLTFNPLEPRHALWYRGVCLIAGLALTPITTIVFSAYLCDADGARVLVFKDWACHSPGHGAAFAFLVILLVIFSAGSIHLQLADVFLATHDRPGVEDSPPRLLSAFHGPWRLWETCKWLFVGFRPVTTGPYHPAKTDRPLFHVANAVLTSVLAAVNTLTTTGSTLAYTLVTCNLIRLAASFAFAYQDDLTDSFNISVCLLGLLLTLVVLLRPQLGGISTDGLYGGAIVLAVVCSLFGLVVFRTHYARRVGQRRPQGSRARLALPDGDGDASEEKHEQDAQPKTASAATRRTLTGVARAYGSRPDLVDDDDEAGADGAAAEALVASSLSTALHPSSSVPGPAALQDPHAAAPSAEDSQNPLVASSSVAESPPAMHRPVSIARSGWAPPIGFPVTRDYEDVYNDEPVMSAKAELSVVHSLRAPSEVGGRQLAGSSESEPSSAADREDASRGLAAEDSFADGSAASPKADNGGGSGGGGAFASRESSADVRDLVAGDANASPRPAAADELQAERVEPEPPVREPSPPPAEPRNLAGDLALEQLAHQNEPSDADAE
jgi:hypothetical protein